MRRRGGEGGVLKIHLCGRIYTTGVFHVITANCLFLFLVI